MWVGLITTHVQSSGVGMISTSVHMHKPSVGGADHRTCAVGGADHHTCTVPVGVGMISTSVHMHKPSVGGADHRTCAVGGADQHTVYSPSVGGADHHTCTVPVWVGLITTRVQSQCGWG